MSDSSFWHSSPSFPLLSYQGATAMGQRTILPPPSPDPDTNPKQLQMTKFFVGSQTAKRKPKCRED